PAVHVWVVRAGAGFGVEHRDAPLEDARGGSAPACVHEGHRPPARIDQGHRRAVGERNREQQAGAHRRVPIAIGRDPEAGRPAAPVEQDLGSVHLPGVRHTVRAGPGAQALPARRHVGPRSLPGEQPQVEGPARRPRAGRGALDQPGESLAPLRVDQGGQPFGGPLPDAGGRVGSRLGIHRITSHAGRSMPTRTREVRAGTESTLVFPADLGTLVRSLATPPSLLRPPGRNRTMDDTLFDSANAAYAQAMYELYARNPDAVPEEWRRLFADGGSQAVAEGLCVRAQPSGHRARPG